MRGPDGEHGTARHNARFLVLDFLRVVGSCGILLVASGARDISRLAIPVAAYLSRHGMSPEALTMRCLAALAEGSPTSAQPLVHLKLNFMSETSLETNHNLSSEKLKQRSGTRPTRDTSHARTYTYTSDEKASASRLAQTRLPRRPANRYGSKTDSQETDSG